MNTSRVGEGSTNKQLIDTVFRGLLSVALFAAFPAFSDIYRLWRRQAGVVPGELAPQAFEYPPIAALVFEPISWLPSARLAVVINGLVMVAAAVLVTWLLQRHRALGSTTDVQLWVASPALLFLLPMNWDVAVALSAVLALLLLKAQQEWEAGLVVGVGFAWKIAPGSLVLPVLPLIEGWQRRIRFLVGGGITLVVSYAAYVLLRPDNWRIHLDFARSRSDYETTVWGGLGAVLQLFGIDLSLDAVNLTSGVAVVAGLVCATAWIAIKRPTFGEAGAVAMGLFLLLNKVFKPAYVLWLVPLLAMAGSRKAYVRLLEAAVLVSFAVVFFPALPRSLLSAAAAVRVVMIVLVVAEIVWRYRSSPEQEV